MAIDLNALKSELTNDPLARGYAALSNELAADSLNSTIDRPYDSPVKSMMYYMAINKSRTNTGTDTTNTSMLGRLIVAANAAAGSDPFGSGVNLTLDQKCSCLAILELMKNKDFATLPYHNAVVQNLLTDLVNAGVLKNTDKTAIIALSNNLQSRASELGFGHVRPLDVAAARAL